MKTLSGHQPVAVLLCKFSDYPDDEPQSKEWFERLVANTDTGGVNDFWRDASREIIDLNGSEVFGWEDIGINYDDFMNKYTVKTTDPNTGETEEASDRLGKIQHAVNAFPNVDFNRFGRNVVVCYNVDVNDGHSVGIGRVAVLIPHDAFGGITTYLAHEIGHGFGFIDSFDESFRETWENDPGVYCDPHDIMSAMGVHHSPQVFGLGGPLLNTALMDIAGWLEPECVLEWSHPEYSPNPVTLTSLSRQPASGLIALKAGGYYVELRTPDGWDAGIPRPTVLIHRIGTFRGDTTSWVIAERPGSETQCWHHEFLAGDSFEFQTSKGSLNKGIVITHWTLRVESIDASAGDARISVLQKYQKFPGLQTDLPIWYERWQPEEFVIEHPDWFKEHPVWMKEHPDWAREHRDRFDGLPDLVVVHGDWAVIQLKDGEFFSIPVNSTGYSVVKELVRAMQVVYGSGTRLKKAKRKKIAKKMLATLRNL